MRKKIFSVLFALVLLLSLGLVMATPVAAEVTTLNVVPFELTIGEYGGEGDEECLSKWSDLADEIAVLLDSGPMENPPGEETWGTDGDEARITIPASSVGITDLDSLTSISWLRYSVSGYAPHVDVIVEVEGGTDALVFEYAYNTTEGDVRSEGQPTYGTVPGAWYSTFDDDEYGVSAIDDTAKAWLNSGPAGGLDIIRGTLAEWKAGTVDESVTGSSTVLRFEIEVDNWMAVSEAYVDDIAINGVVYYGSIQDAVDNAVSTTISVAAGTYDEQVVIDKALTLQGAGDDTIIQPSGPELIPTTSIPWIGTTIKAMSAIVSVETTGDEVTIRDLKIDASLITSKSTLWVGGLVYLETSGTIENLTVTINSALPDRTAGIFAGAITQTSLVEATGCNVIGYNRAGIYALGAEFTADYHHNEINGPGSISTGVPNGMFFLEGAKGSATYNTVTDLFYTGEQYRSTGMGTYDAGLNVRFAYNTISNVQNAFALSNGTSGTIVEYNDIFNNHTGARLESGAQSSIIRYNDIHDNDFAIRCESEVVSGMGMGPGNVAHYNNFVDNPGLAWINYEGSGAGLPYTYEGAVCNLDETDILDATMNWWGDISGPQHETTNPGGTGDSVSDDVNYVPWLTRDFQTVLDDNIAYFGIPMVQLNTGWNTFSTPIALDPACATWGSYKELGDGLSLYNPGGEYVNAYYFLNNGEDQGFVEVGDNYRLKPCDAIYVQMAAPDIAAILFSPATSVPTKELYAGWNLVSLALEGQETMSVRTALTTVSTVTGDLTGWELAVSPPLNPDPWMRVNRLLSPKHQMETTRGYWVFMINDGTLAGFSMTPIPLGPH